MVLLAGWLCACISQAYRWVECNPPSVDQRFVLQCQRPFSVGWCVRDLCMACPLIQFYLLDISVPFSRSDSCRMGEGLFCTWVHLPVLSRKLSVYEEPRMFRYMSVTSSQGQIFGPGSQWSLASSQSWLQQMEVGCCVTFSWSGFVWGADIDHSRAVIHCAPPTIHIEQRVEPGCDWTEVYFELMFTSAFISLMQVVGVGVNAVWDSNQTPGLLST